MFKISCEYVIPKDNPAYWEISAVVEKPEKFIEELKSKLNGVYVSSLDELCCGDEEEVLLKNKESVMSFSGGKAYAFLQSQGSNALLKIFVPDEQVNKTVIEILRAYLVRFEQ